MSNECFRYKKVKSASDFSRVLNGENNAFSTKFFNLYFTQSQTQSSKLGIIVSKKALKKAIDRNSIKRCAREVFRRGLKEELFVFVILVLFENFSMQHKKEFTKSLKRSINFLHNIKIL